MATYEFKCEDCLYEFEQHMTISEYSSSQDSDITCVNCEGQAFRHFRTAPQLDTYFPGSTKDEHPVHGI
jgi:hypothetical protein